jgi:hypothetical protein
MKEFDCNFDSDQWQTALEQACENWYNNYWLQGDYETWPPYSSPCLLVPYLDRKNVPFFLMQRERRQIHERRQRRRLYSWMTKLKRKVGQQLKQEERRKRYMEEKEEHELESDPETEQTSRNE